MRTSNLNVFAAFCTLLLASFVVTAQRTFDAIANDSKTPTQDIVIFNIGASLSKIGVINKTAGTYKPEVIPSGKTSMFVKVKLKNGANEFTLVAYDSSGKAVPLVRDLTINLSGYEPPKPPPPTAVEENFIKGKKLTVGNLPTRNPNDAKVELKITDVPNNATKILVLNENKSEGDKGPGQWFKVKKTSGKTNNPQEITVDLKDGDNPLTISAVDKDNKVIQGTPIKTTIGCISCENAPSGNRNYRAIVGVMQAGASSAASKSNPFLDFYARVPLGNATRINPRAAAWVNFRLGSTTKGFSSLSNISTSVLSNALGTDSSINNIVQSFSVTAGGEYRVGDIGVLHPFFIPGKTSFSFIGGAGITSPLESTRDSAQVFAVPMVPKPVDSMDMDMDMDMPDDSMDMDMIVNQDFKDAFKEITNADGTPKFNFDGKTNVAFVIPERDRFMKNLFGGIRFTTEFFNKDGSPKEVSPAMFDIRYGFDEEITKKFFDKGKGILTFEGFTPFPFSNDYVFLYGGAKVALGRRAITVVPKLFLKPAETFDLNDSNNTVVISQGENPFSLQNRDIYWFGIGVDVLKLFKSAAKKEEKPQ